MSTTLHEKPDVQEKAPEDVGIPDSGNQKLESVDSSPPGGAARSRGVVAFERWLVRQLLTAVENRDLLVRLWDGTEITLAESRPTMRLFVHDRPTFYRILLNPMLYFGEAYSTGRITIEGDLVEFMTTVLPGTANPAFTQSWRSRLAMWLSHTGTNTMSKSLSNVSHHYDIGDDFYELWLDREMVYTCAYFPSPDMTLEDAQVAKMDHVCRKVKLQPGQRVVEAGCGWGALAVHMARHYGVTVRAYNISKAQLEYARRRAKAEGLESRVEFIDDDYRNIRETCDVFVSVGMLEHVGTKNYESLGRVIDRCLAPHGRGLLHSIGQNTPAEVNPWLRRRIFPGAYPPTLREMLHVLEPFGFSILDAENLRLHYAKTLSHWLARFESSVDRVRAMFDEEFVRTWRMYLAGSQAGFLAGSLQLFQVVFARPMLNDLPSSRAHLYAAAESR